MPQFHVYRNPRASARHAPYLLDVQSDLIVSHVRVVVPLVTHQYFGPAARTLNPVLVVQDKDYVLSPAEIGSLPIKQLGAPVADLGASRYDIIAALDFLFCGI